MPDCYVLSVGVNSALTQPWAWDAYAKDAWFVSAALDGTASLYDHLHRRVLAGPRATRAAVLDGLRWLAACVQAQDVALLFFSAHGELDPHGGYCLSLAACSDGEAAGLWGRELRTALAKLRGKTVVLMDTCHAAGILTPGAPLPATFVVACGANEFSYGQTARRDRPHGFFVMALCEALRGTGTLPQGLFRVQDLIDVLPARTRRLSPHQTAVVACRPGEASIGLARVAGAAPMPPTRRRNPFGIYDVVDPDGQDVAAFAATVTRAGHFMDAKARALNSGAPPVALDGQWESRWRRGAARTWQVGQADLRCRRSRLFMHARDDSGDYLIEARRVGPEGLVGRYVNLNDDRDSSPWVGRMVSDARIDGCWEGGRWDFRRADM